MNRLRTTLISLERDLGLLGIPWALVGGLAVAARSEPRSTRDVDVAISVASDKDAERISRALMERGYGSFEALEQTAAGRLATMRLVARRADVPGTIVDLLFASSGIEPEIVAEATRERVLAGVTVPVARLGYLMALKTLAMRPRDLADFGLLLRYASETELALARAAVRLIVERSFHRGHDLAARFESLVEQGPDAL